MSRAQRELAEAAARIDAVIAKVAAVVLLGLVILQLLGY